MLRMASFRSLFLSVVAPAALLGAGYISLIYFNRMAGVSKNELFVSQLQQQATQYNVRLNDYAVRLLEYEQLAVSSEARAQAAEKIYRETAAALRQTQDDLGSTQVALNRSMENEKSLTSQLGGILRQQPVGDAVALGDFYQRDWEETRALERAKVVREQLTARLQEWHALKEQRVALEKQIGPSIQALHEARLALTNINSALHTAQGRLREVDGSAAAKLANEVPRAADDAPEFAPPPTHETDEPEWDPTVPAPPAEQLEKVNQRVAEESRAVRRLDQELRGINSAIGDTNEQILAGQQALLKAQQHLAASLTR